jgi:hypothetical protein
MLKSSDVHCDMKIKFCTSEGPVVYWIQVLGDQDLIYATIGIKSSLPGERYRLM